MTFFYLETIKILILLVFSIILASVILFLSYSASNSSPDVEKVSAYECGFDPYEDARNVFDVKFYLVAILFIVFDLEAIYFFPWCSCSASFDVEGFWCLFDFIVELIVGLLYAWEMGAFSWS